MRRAVLIETTLLATLAAVLAVAGPSLWRDEVRWPVGPTSFFAPDGRSALQVGRSGLHVIDVATASVRHRIDRGYEGGGSGGRVTFEGFVGDSAALLTVREATPSAGYTVTRRYLVDLDAGTLEGDTPTQPEPTAEPLRFMGRRVWLPERARSSGAVRSVVLPERSTNAYAVAADDEGRRVAFAFDPQHRPPQTSRVLQRGRSGVVVHDGRSGRTVRRWDDQPPLIDLWALRFADADTLLALGDRTGRLVRLDLTDGSRTTLATLPPPDLAGKAGAFPQAVLALLLAWTVLWCGRRRWTRADRTRGGLSFHVAVLLAVGWAALRLLAGPLWQRSPTLWTLLHRGETWPLPVDALLVVTTVLALPTAAFAAGAAWHNATRPGRLAWLLALAAAVLLTAAADLDLALDLGLSDRWLEQAPQ